MTEQGDVHVDTERRQAIENALRCAMNKAENISLDSERLFLAPEVKVIVNRSNSRNKASTTPDVVQLLDGSSKQVSWKLWRELSRCEEDELKRRKDANPNQAIVSEMNKTRSDVGPPAASTGSQETLEVLTDLMMEGDENGNDDEVMMKVEKEDKDIR